MERMEEVIPEADHQALQHMLSESAGVVGAGGTDQVAQEANRLLGHADSALLIDERVPEERTHRWGGAAVVRPVEQRRTARGGCLPP
ncbi:MAG: hypothetical protein IPL59_13660 [Candidatus Competibacteraceae bacterium]|nr:hypothetical protein [Candidatus Competibacteraceae bacterium]